MRYPSPLGAKDPLQNQLAFAEQPGPQHLILLLTEYLVVCGGAAWLSNRWRAAAPRREPSTKLSSWTDAAVMAVEFFPSPIFAGELMAYLSQFSNHLNGVQQALLNLAATWFAAFLAHLLPRYLSDTSSSRGSSRSSNVGSNDGGSMTTNNGTSTVSLGYRTALIVKDTLDLDSGLPGMFCWASLARRMTLN
jgi:hypothetical protein